MKASRHSLTPVPLHTDCRRTFENPHSTSAETAEGYCTFGNPSLSSAETVEGWCTCLVTPIRAPRDSSSLVDIRKHLLYARRHLVTLALAPQRLSKASRHLATPVQTLMVLVFRYWNKNVKHECSNAWNTMITRDY